MGLHAVVLAGGTGSRLWPLSTPENPKQFQPVLSSTPLVNQAIERAHLVAGDNVWVVTDATYAPVVRALAPEVAAAHVLAEPQPRGTLGAVLLAAAAVRRVDPEGVLALLPSDHLCPDGPRLAAAIRALAPVLGARDIGLVATPTVVINPAFGHVRPGGTLVADIDAGVRICSVDDYVEKPQSAEELGGGTWLRNMGLVIGHGRALLDAAEPAWVEAAEAVVEGAPDGLARWDALTVERIEDAVLPQSSALVVAEVEVEWIDVGTWPALFEHVDAAPTGNVVDGPVHTIDARGNVVVTTGRPVAVAGLKDVLVVVTEDQVLVCDRNLADQAGAIGQAVRAAAAEPAA
jgi:mannose-1-phosphate guanylyltransferase